MKTHVANPHDAFSHANRIVKKFSGWVFLVQATGSLLVSSDITGQLKVVVGDLQLVEGIPKLSGVESTLYQSQLECLLDRLGFLSVFRHIIAGLWIGEAGTPSRVQSHCRREDIEVLGSPIDRAGRSHGKSHNGPLPTILG